MKLIAKNTILLFVYSKKSIIEVQGQKQIQKLSQKMVLSRNMQQSINILSMQTIDLKSFIEKEIIENPFLEMDDSMNFDKLDIWSHAPERTTRLNIPRTVEFQALDGAHAPC